MSLCSSARRLSIEGILGYNKAGPNVLFFCLKKKKKKKTLVLFDLFCLGTFTLAIS